MRPQTPSSPQPPARLSTHRRTVLRGAAWSVPVVAVSTAAPAFASSGATDGIRFDSSSYTGVTCGSLSGVTVSVTEDGTAATNAPVTVTLGSGFTFGDGSTTRSFTTDAQGQVVLPAIVSAMGGATATFTAVSGSLTTAVPATAAAAAPGVATYRGPAGASWPVSTYAAVPTGSIALGRTTYLAPNGDLYVVSDAGAVNRVASGVTSAAADVNAANETVVGYYDGRTHFRGAGGVTSDFITMGAGTLAVGRDAFLGPGRALYLGSTQIATEVTSAVGRLDSGNGTALSWVSANGGASMRASTGAVTSYPSVPAGSTAVGLNVFLGPNGTLLLGNANGTTSVIATGVTSAHADHNNVDGTVVSYVTADGGHHRRLGEGTSTEWVGVPRNATAVGRQTFLTPDGRLFVGNTLVASGVSSAAGRLNSANETIVGYVQTPNC